MNEKALEKSTAQNKSLFFDVGAFEHAQRVSKMLSTSTMVPEHFRNNIGNCVIALNYAHRAQLDPFMAMQKMYIIKGKPAIEAQLQIALFNKSENYSNLKYRMVGEGDKQTCTAYAIEKETGDEITGPPVSIALAKAEGWYSKNGSKWKTLPDLMLRYRAASFFIRLHAPETTFGLLSKDEAEDMDVIDISNTESIQEEIDQNANQEVIDIDQEQVQEESTDELTDEEKEEIIQQEAKQVEQQRQPGF